MSAESINDSNYLEGTVFITNPSEFLIEHSSRTPFGNESAYTIASRNVYSIAPISIIDILDVIVKPNHVISSVYKSVPSTALRVNTTFNGYTENSGHIFKIQMATNFENSDQLLAGLVSSSE